MAEDGLPSGDDLSAIRPTTGRSRPPSGYPRGMAQLVLTVVGPDRAGLVSTLSSTVAEHDGNWLGSRMARLAGAFAGIVLVDVPDARQDDLRAALDSLTSQGLTVTATDTRQGEAPDQVVLKVRLLGHDHPGIVRQVTGTLARLGVTIDDMTTGLREAPMGDGVLFEAEVLCRITGATTDEDLRAELESIASELMVDISVVDRT